MAVNDGLIKIIGQVYGSLPDSFCYDAEAKQLSIC
jgi:hypothetical protein